MSENKYPSFNLTKSPLTGINLVEASAGTGKTYTISALYLRLLLEAGLTVDSILVVTFTEAATQELKERIRSRIKEAIRGFESPSEADPFILALVSGQSDPKVSLQRLWDALRTFDQAAVYTIHGFCQRMLIENAFESNSLLETELVTGNRELILLTLKDYWRTSLYTETKLFSHWLAIKNISPERMLSFVQNAMKPGIALATAPEFSDVKSDEDALEIAYDQCRSAWHQSKESVFSLLSAGTVLNGNRYRKKSIPGWVTLVDIYFSGANSPLSMPEVLEKFTASYMNQNGSVKKGCVPPQHEFFNLADRLYELQIDLSVKYENNYLWHRFKAADYVQRELTLKKQRLGIAGFDDLLTNLHNGLKGKNGEALSEKIRNKYKAAMIDEFQDTDPVQYDIFSTVFGKRGDALFLIGDPKQAIYSFRGADIFAYMGAVQDAESAYTLSANYRSEPSMVMAVNTLFGNASNPFVFDDIPFSPVEAAEKKDRPEVVIEDGSLPLTIWQLEAGDSPMNIAAAEAIAGEAVGSEILNLLNLAGQGKARIGDRQIRESDIAVLVRTNREADEMKSELSRRNIPAVIYSTGNVFHSNESLELRQILQAVLRPGDDGALKAALATEIIGYSADEIRQLDQRLPASDAARERWAGYYREWQRAGFIRMFSELTDGEGLLTGAMALCEGERRATNLLHLGQLLHKSAVENRYGPERLMVWFDKLIDPLSKDDTEEHQLRLERDDDAVKIVTIHKSKGMEYPIVFCPHVWHGRKPSRPEFCIFHDKNNDRGMSMDINGSDTFDLSLQHAETEMLAEEIRILYVALTRAAVRCYLAWGRVRNSEYTALARLLYSDGGNSDIPETDMAVREKLAGLTEKSCGSIGVARLPVSGVSRHQAEAVPTKLSVRSFTGNTGSGFSIASFSSISYGAHHDTDGRDMDSYREGGFRSVADLEKTIFTFPKGAGPGTFLHNLIENINFTAGEPHFKEVVTAKLDQYGYGSEWEPVLTGMIRNLVSVPLKNSGRSFELSSVAGTDRINELEFYFPLKKLRSEDLNRLLQKHGAGMLSQDLFDRFDWRLDFSDVHGYMKGYIDIVFRVEGERGSRYFIGDWKSNWLGERPEDYHRGRILDVMQEESYVLQYLLYTVALNRYLEMKLGDAYDYDSDFGGVFYLFLRGIQPEISTTNGIFFDRPDKGLIKDLTALLLEV